MSTYLFTLARWAYRRRRMVLGLWLLAAVIAIVLAVASGGKTDNTFTVPGTESQQASDLLRAKLPALGGGQTQLVFATHGSALVTDPRYRAGIETSITSASCGRSRASPPSPTRSPRWTGCPRTARSRSARCSTRRSPPTSATPP